MKTPVRIKAMATKRIRAILLIASTTQVWPGSYDRPRARDRKPELRVDTSGLAGAGNLVHREGVGSGAHRDFAAVGSLADLLVRARHDVSEALVDLALLPEEGLQVLHHLEVGNGYTAGIGDDVRDQEHAFLGEDVVGFRGSGSIGSLGDDLCPHPIRIALVDLAFKGSRHEDRALELKEVVGIDALGA